ncbi:hypothetical protein ACQB6R_02795 [Propionibacteriaceae bacterium G1746]|uniref:hypothetical protein n=1 Tax=Aestuariimicrobium sp. G57 TaxID=3418485 RepID=UPI003C14CDD3
MTPVMARVRNFANWCNLSTPLGLVVASIGRARVVRGEDGIWLAEGYRLGFPMASAFTVGSVVLTAAPSWAQIESRRPGLLRHEVNHTWQYAYSLGLLYLPLYAGAMGWSWLRTGDRASANFFEQSADLALGGYEVAPTRPLAQGIAQLRGLVGHRQR